MDFAWQAQLRFLIPALAATLAAAAAVVHVLLHKRDSRGAFGWIAVCLLFPLFGPVLYAVFGINRVQIRAQRLDQRATHALGQRAPGVDSGHTRRAPAVPEALTGLAAAADELAAVPLVAGNELQVLHHGDQAYPAMLEAIDQARAYVYLATYIFETDVSGRQFVAALARAAARGVDVRVMLDGFGEYYAWPRRRAGGLLRRQGVSVARFLAPSLLPPSLRINLRNHRKILVVDGVRGFTGGMNIGDRHVGSARRPRRVDDMHFALAGPVVHQMETVFLADWAFVTGERTAAGDSAAARGSATCRVIDDGPTEDPDRVALLLSAAVAAARERVLIMTPYFLPSAGLIAALQTAALRGLDVSIVLPAANNLPYVHWASRHGLRELLVRGVKIYYQPAPFVHSKLFVVDDSYALIGSANLDPRSLRLNFEMQVEVYDRRFVAELADHLAARIEASRRYTAADFDQRSLPVRLRDAVAWLFTPYL